MLKLQTILVPVDFSLPSLHALRYAIELARMTGGTALGDAGDIRSGLGRAALRSAAADLWTSRSMRSLHRPRARR